MNLSNICYFVVELVGLWLARCSEQGMPSSWNECCPVGYLKSQYIGFQGTNLVDPHVEEDDPIYRKKKKKKLVICISNYAAFSAENPKGPSYRSYALHKLIMWILHRMIYLKSLLYSQHQQKNKKNKSVFLSWCIYEGKVEKIPDKKSIFFHQKPYKLFHIM